MHHVERWEDRSVLRFTVNALEETDESYVLGLDAFNRSLAGSNYAFELIDPVGGMHYAPMQNSDEQSIGSIMPDAWVPEADYEIELHYPPVPEDVDRVSLHTSSTAGEFTGIPVIDAEPPEQPPSHDGKHGDIEPGDTVELQLRDHQPAADPEEWANELHAITEESDRTRTDGTGQRTVGLHADVLFEFDEAELTGEAADVLTEIADETRADADPDEPPIAIVGHTDGQGSDDYNQALSEERAEAVHEFLSEERAEAVHEFLSEERAEAVHECLSEELGDDYEYETEGRGADEPVADESGDEENDVEEAQAANRRVEISYRLLAEAERGEADTGGDDDGDGGGGSAAGADVAPPAPFREDDGEVVDSGSGTFLNGNAAYNVHVHPMYRDGAYLVGVFEFEHGGGSGAVPPISNVMAGEYGGGQFTRFSVSAEGTDEVLRAVRIGDLEQDGDTDAGTYLSSRYFNTLPKSDEDPKRMFAYFPAPTGDVDEVTLDADPFGEFTVPIE
ncbi:OmpA family protein [Nocardiopsis sp. HNM0947]|uniref:OmpA family protein n=1 Tax=Nocardiopsis coralli TaxID=2772213 RepID=A0ABR9P778_9ACTN|nr:OmpA family protein [Nocardiopsis coralli]